jgi:hypothetical protein
LKDTGRDYVTQALGIETRRKKPLNKYLLNECIPGMPASLYRKMQT